MSNMLLVKKGEEPVPGLTQKLSVGEIIMVGSHPSATIQIDDSQISPEQLVITCEADQTILLCRAEGAKLNDEEFPIGALHDLRPGDIVTVGSYSFVIEPAANTEFITVDDNLTSENGSKSQFVTGQPVEAVSPVFNHHLIELKDAPNFESDNERKTTKPRRSLNDVLEDLRSDEKFYFQIENANAEKHNFYVEMEEMWIGWANSGECIVSGNPHEIEIPRAYIRKDWSGVVLYPLQPANIRLNDALLDEPHRLKNDDHMFLLSKNGPEFNNETIVKFHEPTALLVLDSILPKKLPPPVLLDQTGLNGSANDSRRTLPETGETYKREDKIPVSSTKIRKKTQYFGYFTLTEIIVMIIGTLITAGFIFLILELF